MKLIICRNKNSTIFLLQSSLSSSDKAPSMTLRPRWIDLSMNGGLKTIHVGQLIENYTEDCLNGPEWARMAIRSHKEALNEI